MGVRPASRAFFLRPRVSALRNMVAVADDPALRMRRGRAHRSGDHGLCKPGCERRLRAADPGDPLVAAVAAEFGPGDPVMREMALRLAQTAVECRGAPVVAAIRVLDGLVDDLRAGVPSRPRGALAHLRGGTDG